MTRKEATRRASGAALLGIAALLVGSASALAAAPSVSLRLDGGYGNKQLVACRDDARAPYVLYRRATRIVVSGVARPATASRRITVEIKRCVGSRSWETVRMMISTTAAGGAFRVVYLNRAAGTFKIRAAYGKPGHRTRSAWHRFLVG